jgi:HKD family nuclease
MITVTLILILSIQLFQKLLLNLVKKDAKFLISTEEYRKGFATVIQFGVIQMLQSYKIFKNRTGMSYDSSVSAKSLTTWRTAKFHSLAWVFGFFAPLSIP